jgi:fructokinase
MARRFSISMKQRRQILASGYIALDLISYQERLLHRAGGTATNVVANLAFLGWEASVVGLIGDDRAGRTIIRDLKGAKVDTRALEARSDVSTPIVLHEIHDKGHRFLFSCPTCRRRFPKYRPLPEAAAAALCDKFAVPSVFFFDRANAGTARLAEFFRDSGALIVFEPSTPGREAERCLRAAHVVKYSSERAAAVVSANKGVSPVLQLVTKGAKGVEGQLRSNTFEVPGFPATVIDAAGAGDWTTAGFLWALSSLDPKAWKKTLVVEALRQAQALAAVSCAFPGARAVSEHLTSEQMITIARGLIDQQSHPVRAVTLGKDAATARGSCPACLTPC